MALLEPRDSHRAFEMCHGDLDLQHQTTMIALSLSDLEAGLENNLWPTHASSWGGGWEGECDGKHLEVDFWLPLPRGLPSLGQVLPPCEPPLSHL